MEGGRSVPWKGAGWERMRQRNLPGRRGQGWAESCFGIKEKGRKGDSAGPRGCDMVRGKEDNGPAGACFNEIMAAWPASQTC